MAATYESASINRAVIALAAIGMAAVVSIAALAFKGTPVPDALASVAGGTVGALATLLTTFMPSPVPGGRRAADAVATPAPLGGQSSTPAPPGLTVSGEPTGVVGEGSNAAGR